MTDGFQTYEIEYGYNGKRWSLQIRAQSFEDAEARLRALSFGKVCGLLVSEVYIPLPSKSAVIRLVARLLQKAIRLRQNYRTRENERGDRA